VNVLHSPLQLTGLKSKSNHLKLPISRLRVSSDLARVCEPFALRVRFRRRRVTDEMTQILEVRLRGLTLPQVVMAPFRDELGDVHIRGIVVQAASDAAAGRNQTERVNGGHATGFIADASAPRC
jgi:hypothetical protein